MRVPKAYVFLVSSLTAGIASGALALSPTETASTGDAKAQPAVPSSAIELAGVAVCTKVENREPVGDATDFASDVGTLWCFTDVRNAQEPTQIYHRWYVGETMINEIPINVQGPRWRCWSQKTIQQSWEGDCRVEIVTESGDVLGTTSFRLRAGAEAPATPDGSGKSAG